MSYPRLEEKPDSRIKWAAACFQSLVVFSDQKSDQVNEALLEARVAFCFFRQLRDRFNVLIG